MATPTGATTLLFSINKWKILSVPSESCMTHKYMQILIIFLDFLFSLRWTSTHWENIQLWRHHNISLSLKRISDSQTSYATDFIKNNNSFCVAPSGLLSSFCNKHILSTCVTICDVLTQQYIYILCWSSIHQAPGVFLLNCYWNIISTQWCLKCCKSRVTGVISKWCWSEWGCPIW